ncbi:MAG: hypothetical protein BWX51_01433 [Bacteroidetes bacterium ADurb.Bin012]|jgi:hypothetical protein|nr:MAG: hypothetical protein BWX51_01433 [Bacteroidetes bacterium ADurb.Bin012]
MNIISFPMNIRINDFKPQVIIWTYLRIGKLLTLRLFS